MLTNGGMKMAKLGLGTYRMQGEVCAEAVAGALARGYRHIDTAEMYGNEEAVGEAIATSKVARADIHLTTKVWHANLAPDAMRRSLETSLAKLRTDHVDLYMIHWPSGTVKLSDSLAQMVRFQEEGLIRSIGVCNFPTAMLREAVEVIGAPVVAHQFEYHVLLDQTKVLTTTRALGLAAVAYCPLAQGRLADHPSLAEIAAKHGVTTAQVALKWLLDQDGVAAIPKASRAESQLGNLGALAVMLDDDDRAAIARLPKDQRFVKPGFAPLWDAA